jgi:hypothetical protein
MGEDHWLTDPRFKDDQARGDHGEIISKRMSEWTGERTTAEALAEIIALIVTPYLMLLTVRNHERALWERALWLPATLLVLGGIGGSVRFLRATWFYVLTCIPVLWVQQTTAQANLGCARSTLKLVVLVALAGVFENRPRQWPIGTLVGSWMTPDVRHLANAMAFATAYFAVTAGLELLIRRARRTAAASAAA